ncbi:MAG TPA: hypothetical protein VHB79_10280 [Polyangiaceae bacterium]|nr:hypothetical protein [Polyangiaceae bacterium]
MRWVALVRRGCSVTGLAVGALALVFGGGCTTNHDALARQPTAGSSGGGAGGSSGFGFGGFGNTGDQPQGGRNNPDMEPAGDNVLTIVNGAIDASSVALCFARVSEGGETVELVGSPLPELPYAASTVLTAIDGLSLIDDEIQPFVIAGDLSRIKKLDCAGAVDLAQTLEAEVTPTDVPAAEGTGGAGGEGGAGPAPMLEKPVLRARALAALPAGTVNIGRSILMVLTGCLGGAYYSDKLQTSACGGDYAPDAPNIAPIAMTLSRDVRFDKVGLQGVHASPATGRVDLRVTGDRGATSLVFAPNLDFGTIGPRPADTRFSPIELGADNPTYGLQALDENANVMSQEAWSDIYEGSGITTLVAAHTYTAILLGPDPLLVKKGWWNESVFALVQNDPTRKD